MLTDAKTWRALSSILLAVFVAALLVGPGVPQWGWIALLASGVAFAIELLLGRSRGAGE